MMDQKADEFHKLVRETADSGILVIVEGSKDRKALNKLGITNVAELNKKPLFQIVEEISNSNDECVILTDLDKKGRELYGRLNSDLQMHGVRVDDRFRNFLFRNTKLRQIEGIANFSETF